ncbi:MAG: PQQ-dependent sugar dehydrogenase [Mucilaginibacter sp.]|nr:PQQ-dependent sugar dehydrogenase [Mucilaginibacter sp.]
MGKVYQPKQLHRSFLLLFFCWLATSASAQSVPAATRPDIKVTAVLNVPAGCSRLARDPVSGHLFFINQNGDVYEVLSNNTSVKRATKADHQITLLQGMAFKGKTLYLIGNRNADSISYEGKIVKGVLQTNGTRVWTPVLTTEKYGYTNTAYNHGYSGMVISPDSNYIFLSSGSRTDHGEIQTRAGLKPGLREEPLTSAIFRIPINSTNLILPNDSARQVSLGYLYADGTRNSFDLAFDRNGNLYGCENSGDRDDPDEMNWIRQGRFYGFPWTMGGNETPMQFAGYDPSKDKLIDPRSSAAQRGFFYNDPAYPKRPNRTFTGPIINIGTYADKYRDPVSGAIRDANGDGLKFGTFTSHRSPLGLVFDRDSLLTDEFKGHGFVMGWTKGATPTSAEIGPFDDPGEDLLHIQLIYDAATDNYKMQTQRIVGGFNNPVDAEMVGNNIYVLELGGTSPKIWKVEMPTAPACGTNAYITREQYNNITGSKVSDLTSNSRYPNSPSSVTRLTSFEAPIGVGDNYGIRIRGYVTAPTTGNYTFWLAADDAAELWLSTDANVSNKKKIASTTAYTLSRVYTKYPSQKSAVIRLTSGKKYYIEALQKENTGSDNLSVKWQLPNGTTELPIPCTRLSPYIQPVAGPQALAANPDTAENIKNNILIYPNPARNMINISLTAETAGKGEISLVNLQGLNVYRSAIKISKGPNMLSIDSSKLGQGLYVLHTNYDGLDHINKVIIE